MKRRKFLIALGVVPPLVLVACEKAIPATIISGKVMDEKGKPIEDIPFTFWGYYNTGGSIVGGGSQETTFKLEKKSDKEGVISFSQAVPEKTREVYLLIGNVYFPYELYKIQAKKNNVNIGFGTSKIAVYPDYANSIDSLLLGQTNEYEIILTKK
jgi:hypothetical protein